MCSSIFYKSGASQEIFYPLPFMKTPEKILKQVKEGNSALLLKEEKCKEGLQELMQYDLIEIKDDKIILTEKGIFAVSTNTQKEIQRLKIEEEMKDFSPEIVRRESHLFLLCLISCVILAIIFLIFDVSDYL